MNNTDTETHNNNENIFIYIMLGIELLNAFVALWTSYKMGYILLNIGHIKCCCFEFDNVYLESESNEEHITREKHELTK